MCIKRTLCGGVGVIIQKNILRDYTHTHTHKINNHWVKLYLRKSNFALMIRGCYGVRDSRLTPIRGRGNSRQGNS